MLEGLGQLSEEDRARINKAVEYDQTVRRLREERRFASLDELKAQIAKDVSAVTKE